MDPLVLTRYDSSELMEIMTATAAENPPNTFWRDMFFPGTMTFQTKYIEFGKIIEHRTMAPLVMPLAAGRPTVRGEAERTRFAPAYLKPMDAVMAVEAFTPNSQSAIKAALTGARPSPLDNWNAAIAEITKKHLDTCVLREEWMAARTVLDGKLTLESQDYPRAVVDFDRDPTLDIVLGAGSVWTDPTVNIAMQLEAWRGLARNARWSGPLTTLILGPAAWAAMRLNPSMKELLDTRYRGTTTNLQIAEPGTADFVERVGNIGNNIEVIVYSGWIEDEAGNHIQLMDSREVLFCGSAVNGVVAYGAIADKGAQWLPVPRFTKMWDEENPSATNILTQSAPLTVPRRINNALRARVVA